MVKFIIVRHGYSVFNKERRFTGHVDAPLDERGIEQAKRNAEYVIANYKIDCIYSSDLSRAYHTVKPIADTAARNTHQPGRRRFTRAMPSYASSANAGNVCSHAATAHTPGSTEAKQMVA